MALIRFDGVAHSYSGQPEKPEDYALHPMNFSWDDGGAYALLGPSGCGKSTLLNICSGLLKPSEGRVFFGDRDVTELSPERRNIAQVFQFPVLYDSMSVYDNLAFPLRNRKVERSHIDRRVREVAEMLDLGDVLKRRASGLGAELKQKISMGRGLVRDDTSAILFDEPLTVIDPQLKWRLRRQLKEVHKQFSHTMIYVTHDQIEALTFADKVVVMSDGEIVQVGTPQELFERPEHTFVGFFIGSPGMNFIECRIDSDSAVIGERRVFLSESQANAAAQAGDGDYKLGIRPEFIEPSAPGEGFAVRVTSIADMGEFHLVTADMDGSELKIKLADAHAHIQDDTLHVQFPSEWLCLYRNERLIGHEIEVAA